MKIQRYITSVDRECGDGRLDAGCGDFIPQGTRYGRMKRPGSPTLCEDCCLAEEEAMGS